MKDLDYIYTSTLPNKNANSINVSHFSEALASKFNFRLFSYIESDVDEIYSHYNIKEKFHIEKLNGNKYLAVIYLLLRKKLKDNIYVRDFFCALILAIFGKKVIWESHIKENRFIYIFGYKLISYFNLFHKIIVITKTLQDKLQLYFSPNNFVVLPDGSRIQQTIKKHIKKESLNIGYVGSFHKGKGVETILKLAKVMKQHKFMIAGGTPEDVINLKKRSSNNVMYFGHLNQKDLVGFYNDLDVGLLPNMPSVKVYNNGQEIGDVTSPLKMFEYLSYGLPIVSSNLPVLREILNTKNSILVDYDDIKAWSMAINQLEDCDLRKSLSAKGLDELKNKYSWNIRAEKIYNLLK